MSDNRAYVYQILPEGTGPDEINLVHQTSPSWVLTVIRWKFRDTLRTQGSDLLAVLDPLIISNDCIQVTVDSDKSSLTPSFTAILKITDTNYLTAIAPGDFVFINMLNWDADADNIAKQALNKQQINGFFDGFKGFFKVQGARELLNADPISGTKTLVCQLNGFAFTEFNNSIYFNPNVLNSEKDQQALLFSSNFGDVFNNLINSRGTVSIQNIIAVLIQTFIGTGPKNQGYNPLVSPSMNTQFLIPQVVGNLLNLDGVTAAKDVYNYIFGVQKYGGASVTDPGTGLNPVGLTAKYSGYFQFTPTPCQGNGLLQAEYWNQVKAWSILNQYTNAPLNEMYTCFKVDTDGDVVPTVVLRQTPFSTESLDSSISATRFMTLPRWYVHPTLITNSNIGRDESARVNFVQCYAQSTFTKGGAAISFETAQGNFVYDSKDTTRSGLRPYIWTGTFDEVPEGQERMFFNSPTWAKIVGDALIGGHLKLNGTITCFGIVEPIAVGDNLELNDVVYQIEQITHNCSIAGYGDSAKKVFRTTLALSNGVSVSSSGLSAVSSGDNKDNLQGNMYAEMANTNAQFEREDDYKFNKLLPGISESQSTPARSNIDIPANLDSNYSFPEPTTRIVVNKRLLQNRKKSQ